MRFVIAAGGTGGHLFPGLAVAETLRADGHEPLITISEKEIDALATQGRSEFRFEKLPGIGMPHIFSPAIFGFLRAFQVSLARCRELFRSFQPDAVLGMGGFTSTAPILAGRMRKLPTFVHESNAIPGKANRLNGRLVTAVLLGFEECAAYFPKARCEITGTPVRTTLRCAIDKATARSALGLEAEVTTLLVVGGSQGARGINRTMTDALRFLGGRSLQVIHLTGRDDEDRVRQAYREAGIKAFVAAFHHRMEEAYGAADLAIARSGAATLTELSFFHLPAILIPYPFAAEDHQTLNAKIFDRAGAAIVMSEREITGEILAKKIIWFFEDPVRLSGMSARSARLAPRDAADRVARTLLKYCEKTRGEDRENR
jgi:UDP-N-acetylglucosamine--N-acetylmuramyl-(pentapeptide) pyrophosphoryl-undecaprenol N-acetylglucosamine transferase